MVLFNPSSISRSRQKQILTPGLVQMVSVLALNKIELKDMINAEMVENPVLEELDSTVPLIDEVASREEERRPGRRQPKRPITKDEKATPLTKSTLAHFFRIIWILAIAPTGNSNLSKSLRSKIFFPART